MHAKELVASVARRTGMPHADVRRVLDTVRDVVAEQLRVYEDTWLPGIGKITAVKTHTGTWRIYMAFSSALADVVGKDVNRV